MKNPAPYVRKQLIALLSGNVLYGGAQVPVYSGTGKFGIPLQVLIQDYSDANDSNKHTFRANASVTLEVVAERHDEDQSGVDAVVELVLNLLKPDTRADNLSTNEFRIWIVGKPNIQSALYEDEGSGVRIIRRPILLNLSITEK